MSSLIVYIVGLLVIWGRYLDHAGNFTAFVCFFAVMLVTNLPKRAFSPLALFYAYYGAWFIVAPMFAQRFDGMLDRPEYQLAIALAFTVFGLGVVAIKFGERIGRAGHRTDYRGGVPGIFALRGTLIILYVIATAMVVMIVQSSGGFSVWEANPGDAFLNRSGSGVYVVLSHFSSVALAALTGYYCVRKHSKVALCVFLAWLLVTSPVHGSKLQISLLAVVSMLPWVRNMKLLTVKTILLYVSFVMIFLLGLYFRNITWVSADTMIPYALNYFNTLENLAISVRDFDPSILMTFFLPFVKFQTPFGLASPDMYFDMNHLLTDIYFPKSWAIRATEQWPVETDLYLNFMFVGGLPLVALYLGIIGFIHGRAIRNDSLGYWAASILMTILMISHLRGSLINWTDFYLYPYIAVIAYLFRRMSLRPIPHYVASTAPDGGGDAAPAMERNV